LTLIAVFAVLLFFWSLASERLDLMVLRKPILFAAAGIEHSDCEGCLDDGRQSGVALWSYWSHWWWK